MVKRAAVRKLSTSEIRARQEASKSPKQLQEEEVLKYAEAVRLAETVKDKDTVIGIIKEYPKIIGVLKDPDIDLQIAAVTSRKNYQNIFCDQKIAFDRGNETLQLAAINGTPYIKDTDNIPKATSAILEASINPSEKVQLRAIERNKFAIEHIPNPSEAVQLAAVKISMGKLHRAVSETDIHPIQFIKNPTESAQVLAVKTDPRAIRYIKEPSDKVLQALAEHNPAPKKAAEQAVTQKPVAQEKPSNVVNQPKAEGLVAALSRFFGGGNSDGPSR